MVFRSMERAGPGRDLLGGNPGGVLSFLSRYGRSDQSGGFRSENGRSGAGIRIDMERHMDGRLFNYCKTSQAPLDFFSFHVYSEYPFTKYEERLTTIMPPDFYGRTIERIHGKLQAAQLPVMPELHVTEWNFSLYDRNYIHDTMFMAPFILRHALQSQGRLHSLGFWSFTDVFEESQAVPAILHGGFGLFNRNGLRKPAYYAFELLAKLTGHLLRQGEGYAIARSGDDYSILLYHYVHVDPLFASGDWSGLTERDRYTVFEEKGILKSRFISTGCRGL